VEQPDEEQVLHSEEQQSDEVLQSFVEQQPADSRLLSVAIASLA